jgi:hypothetical protein
LHSGDLTVVRKRQLTLAEAEIIRARYAAGETQVELAGAFNCTQVNISRVVRGKILTGPRKRKLTKEQVQTIRLKRLTERSTLEALGKKFGLNPSETKAILDRKLYADVELSEAEVKLMKQVGALKIAVDSKV